MKNQSEKEALEQEVLNALNESMANEEILTDSQLSQAEGGKNGVCFNFRRGCGASSAEDKLEQNSREE